MKQHKFRIEVGEYFNRTGAWMTSKSQVFDTVIYCNIPTDGIRMLES